MSLIDQLEAAAGQPWGNIRAARERARERRQQLEVAVAGLAPVDTSIVTFGSLAREELTAGSDIDWTLLVDGQANPQHFDASQAIERALEAAGVKPPGREGTFGGLAFSHEILHRIGGADDTNRNTTQRILLLLESLPIGNPEAHDRVIRTVLKRYITEDYGWVHKSVSVPRFLQNDVARYWRTVAVDFAYKRRQRAGSGWALRTVKLRLSRKLTYASGLLVCFSPALGFFPPPESEMHESDRTLPLVEFLADSVGMTPLERVAAVGLRIDVVRSSCVSLFSAYDEFLGLLNDPDIRKHLDELPPGEASGDSTYERAREIGHRFQAALDGVFLDNSHPILPKLTKKYGVF
jgi:predicted nucleotidyltransferase